MSEKRPRTPPSEANGALVPHAARVLSAAQLQQLSEAPAASVWLGNINNPYTRRAYQSDVEAFVAFCGIESSDELRLAARAHANRLANPARGRQALRFHHPAQALRRLRDVRVLLQRERR
jgi:hypothetical protein